MQLFLVLLVVLSTSAFHVPVGATRSGLIASSNRCSSTNMILAKRTAVKPSSTKTSKARKSIKPSAKPKQAGKRGRM